MILDVADPKSIYYIAVLEGTDTALPYVTYVDEEKGIYRAVLWYHRVEREAQPKQVDEGVELRPATNAVVGAVWLAYRDGQPVLVDHYGPVKLRPRTPDRSSLNAFQLEHGRWADLQFPRSTVQTILKHLEEEVTTELVIDENAEEAADVFLLLLHFAHKKGFSLWNVAIAKHERNVLRTWGQPDVNGVTHHIKDSKDVNPRKDT